MSNITEILDDLARMLHQRFIVQEEHSSRLSKDLAHAEGLVKGQGERLEKMERFIDGSSMGCAEMSKRIEKMEKALSEEMAKTREMDDILAGVVKRVGHESEAPEGDFKTSLLKWLDIEIAMAEDNLDQANRANMVLATAKMQAMLATYKAVKAHIQG